MSVKVVASVLQRSPADRATRMVELVLAEFADSRGVCWPSIPMIAEGARVDRRTVFRAIERLKGSGSSRFAAAAAGATARPTT